MRRRTHVGNADQVVGAALLGTRHAPNLELDVCVVNPFRLDLPGQAESFEVVPELLDFFRQFGAPMGDQTRDIALKCAWKSRPECRNGVCSLGISAQSWQVNDFHDAMNESLKCNAPWRQKKRVGKTLVPWNGVFHKQYYFKKKP